jgi:hypothetical protein
MSERAPPATASWLIRRLGPARYRESLMGDLIEQFHLGRSDSWYWRQVVIAVVLARLHPVCSLLAVPKVKAIVRLVIECAILALGLGTLTWAAAANTAPCASSHSVCAKSP